MRFTAQQSVAVRLGGLLPVLLIIALSALQRDARAAPAPRPATAVFAGGCFWCTESDFEKLPGVLKAVSGYTGGRVINPTYAAVSGGGTGHAESVRVTYDPTRVTYAQLIEYYWRTVDPTVRDQQFCDHGNQYRTAIFYATAEEKQIAEASRDALLRKRSVANIYTQIVSASRFYVAEDEHQDYYKKNPLRYRYYRHGCGRDARLEEIWGAAPH